MQPLIEHPFLIPLWKASWQAAVLIVLVLAVQWIFRGKLDARWRYSLWLLVVIRLAVPSTIPSAASVFNLLDLRSGLARGTATQRARNPWKVQAGNALPAGNAKPAAASSSLSAADSRGRTIPWLVVAWSAGASALAVFLLASHWGLSRRVTRNRPLIDADVLNLLEDCKQAMAVRAPVTLIETPAVRSPALFGFVRPRLLLPAGFVENFSREELRYVLLHELGHIKRHDILVGWLAAGLQIIHWFNPLVWVAFHRMRVDRELACDALTLGRLRPEEAQPYGQTIIKLLQSFGGSAWGPSLAGTVENRNQIKERIRMIAKFKKSHRGLGWAVALLLGLGLITLTDAQPQPAGSPATKGLPGTWILVGTPGDVGLPPAAGGRLKSLTDTHWSITHTDPKDGAVLFHHGGTYTLNEREYVEQIEFANSNTKDLIGKSSKFTYKLDGDTLTLIGVGNPWKEVWQRAGQARPAKLDASPLQGTWTGQESRHGKGACSLVVKGSSLEFQGADTNEWYKGSFTVYDTHPRQLVTVVAECPFPQYVGRTAYAIYELENNTLTVAGNEPGNPIAPRTFDARGARKFVFKK